jgi:DNA gyrase/topoisomerase IV subunit B
LSGLPAKYKKPTGKKDIELIIVEGDSAMGTVMEGRDSSKQGVFPIRGKIINAFGNSRQAVFSNEEVQAITKIILGTEYKRNFDIKDVKVSKIIFMCDADVDGAHIAALLLRLFLLYFPQLIQAGMVYKAIPPLYSIKEGKKNRYFTEQIDIVRYIQKKFLDKYSISIGKNSLSSKEVTKFLLVNTDYIYYLERVANTYAVDPNLLEIVLNNYVSNKDKINFEKLKKEVSSVYRFMNVEKNKGTIILKGTIDKVNSLIISDKFINDCRFILDIIHNNDNLFYNINGEKKSIYNIMKLYDTVSPSSVQRYKGLGEMDYDELAESTLYPGSDRTLVRYTLDDIKEEIEAVREYESNPKKILGLVNNVTRDDLID